MVSGPVYKFEFDMLINARKEIEQNILNDKFCRNAINEKVIDSVPNFPKLKRSLLLDDALRNIGDGVAPLRFVQSDIISQAVKPNLGSKHYPAVLQLEDGFPEVALAVDSDFGGERLGEVEVFFLGDEHQYLFDLGVFRRGHPELES